MSKQCYITVRDETFCYVTGLAPCDNDFLWNKFGIHVDGYFFTPQYKLGRWDGKIRFFEKTGKTFLRILDSIIPYLDKWDYDIVIQDERAPITPPSEQITADHFKEYGITLRPYQVEAINLALEAGDGIFLMATGAGKTSVTAGICAMYSEAGFKTLTIVPSVDLVNQTAAWYRVCGLDTGEYCGDKKNIHHWNVVSTWQSLQNNPKILEGFHCIIVDECHGAKGDVLKKLINDNGKNAHFRFGVTGTLPTGEAEKMSVLSALGNVRYTISARWLIDNGYLSEIEIEPIEIRQSSVEEEFPDFGSEKTFLSKSDERLDLIADLICIKAEQFGNTLVLVNSVQMGERLQKKIKDSVFLYGATENSIRKENYDEFEEQDGVIKIATFGIASTGISINRIFCLFLIDTGKSYIKVIQSVGRGLRRSGDKNFVHVVDLHSNLKWSKKHAKERLKYFKTAEYPVIKTQTIKL